MRALSYAITSSFENSVLVGIMILLCTTADPSFPSIIQGIQSSIAIRDPAQQDLHENGLHAVELTEDTFDKWINEHDFTFVAFTAPW